jgi:hypothetical protein
MNNYIELVIKSSSKEKPRTGWLHWWTLPTIKELTTILLNPFQYIVRKGTSPN